MELESAKEIASGSQEMVDELSANTAKINPQESDKCEKGQSCVNKRHERKRTKTDSRKLNAGSCQIISGQTNLQHTKSMTVRLHWKIIISMISPHELRSREEYK